MFRTCIIRNYNGRKRNSFRYFKKTHLIRLLRQDKEVYGNGSFYIDNKRIDKKYIKLIYKGTGEDTF